MYPSINPSRTARTETADDLAAFLAANDVERARRWPAPLTVTGVIQETGTRLISVRVTDDSSPETLGVDAEDLRWFEAADEDVLLQATRAGNRIVRVSFMPDLSRSSDRPIAIKIEALN